MDGLIQRPDGIELTLRVVPGAKRSGWAGTHGGALKVRIQAPAVEGRANRALSEFVAESLGVRPSAVTILSGERGRLKRVHVAGCSIESARKRLVATA